MKEKYSKLNKMFRKKSYTHAIKDEKQQNRIFIPDFRGIQGILLKPTEDKTVRDS